jgi:hypothetical protein
MVAMRAMTEESPGSCRLPATTLHLPGGLPTLA